MSRKTVGDGAAFTCTYAHQTPLDILSSGNPCCEVYFLQRSQTICFSSNVVVAENVGKTRKDLHQLLQEPYRGLSLTTTCAILYWPVDCSVRTMVYCIRMARPASKRCKWMATRTARMLFGPDRRIHFSLDSAD